MSRSGISAVVNPADRYIIFKFRGVLGGKDMLQATEEAYAGLDEPWLYNRIYDLRSFINIVSVEDLTALVKQWEKIVGRRHAPMRFAVVTDDPVRLARTKAYTPMFPHLDVAAFPTLAAAIAWLKEETIDHPEREGLGHA